MEKNIDTYGPDFARSYSAAGVFYDNQGKPKKAEKYYLDAIEIYERLVKRNPDAYELDLAGSYNNVGAFYAIQGQPGKAEKYFLAAIEIYERLVKKNAAAFEPYLASICFNYCFLKKDGTYLIKAYEIAKRRQDDPRCKKIVEFVESM